MKKVVVDSSVIIEYLRTNKGSWMELVKLVEDKKIIMIVPVVVLGEIWSGKSMSLESQVNKVAEVLSVALTVDLKRKDSMLAGEIRRKYGVSMTDAFIAACALSNKANLSTLNTNHFEKVKGLKLLQA